MLSFIDSRQSSQKEDKMSVGLDPDFEDDIVDAILNTPIYDDDDLPDPDGDGGLPLPASRETSGHIF